MENKDYLTFTHPNCCDPALTVIERCFDGNANFLKVTVPGVGSSMVFEKATLIVSKVDNCNDTGCGLPFKGTAESPFLGYILLKGKMFYVAEAATGLSNNRFKNTLEVKFNNTTIDGNSYATTAELYDAIMGVVVDCDCSCSDVPMPCEARLTGISSGGEGEESYIALNISQSTGATAKAVFLNNEGAIVFTSEPVVIAPDAAILLTGSEQGYFQDGNTIRILITNGRTTCFIDVPIIEGEAFVVNNEAEVNVPLAGYFIDNFGECESETPIEPILFYSNYDPGVVIDGEDLVFQPDESEPESETVGNIGLARICNGNIDVIIISNVNYEEIVRPEGLRMVFTYIGKVPGAITDPTVVAQWNAFYNLPTNGTAFSSVAVYGNEVVLVGGGAMTIKASAFTNNTSLLEIDDQSGIVTAINNFCFSGCTSATTFTFPALTTMQSSCFTGCTSVITFSFPLLATITGTYCFQNCTSATTFTFPSLTTVGSESFRNCTAATTITMALCTALGATVGDDNCFFLISGSTINITVAASLAIANGGSPDGDLVSLLANNPLSTINYI